MALDRARGLEEEESMVFSTIEVGDKHVGSSGLGDRR